MLDFKYEINEIDFKYENNELLERAEKAEALLLEAQQRLTQQQSAPQHNNHRHRHL